MSSATVAPLRARANAYREARKRFADTEVGRSVEVPPADGEFPSGGLAACIHANAN
jgi:hypothetical protein